MTAYDLTAFSRDLARETKSFVAEFVGKAIGGIAERLTVIEQRLASVKDGTPGPPGEKGEAGKDAEAVDLAAIAQRAADLVPRARDGRDVDMAVLEASIAAKVAALNWQSVMRDELTRMVSAIQPPKDGRDGINGKDADPLVIKSWIDAEIAKVQPAAVPDVAAIVKDVVAAMPQPAPCQCQCPSGEELESRLVGHAAKALASLPPARDGRDVDPAHVEMLVSAAVTKAIADVPKPQDGKDGARGADGISVTVADVEPLIVERVEKAMAEAPRPRDGVDGKDGHSVTLADVEPLVADRIEKRLAEMPKPKDGQSVTLADIEPLVQQTVTKAVGAMPRAKDGASVTVADVEPMVREVVTKTVDALPRAQDGTSITVEDVAPLVRAEVTKAIEAIPRPKDGHSVTLADIEPLVREVVGKAIDDIPTPKDGQSVTVADVEPLIRDAITKAIDAMPRAQDGTSVTLADVEPLIREAVAQLPVPKDGTSITAADVEPMVRELVSKAVADIPDPKDGVGLAGALLDRDGHLVVTLTDGTAKDVGRVVGADVDMDSVTKTIREEVAKFPPPKDGKDGQDGADGIGFDDLDVVIDDRGAVLKFAKGDRVNEYVLPTLIDRGIYRPGVLYPKGSVVTSKGGMWIASADTSARPGDGATPWRLSVKPGRDGRDGKDAVPPKKNEDDE